MLKKTYILIAMIFIFGLAAAAWALTPHQDYKDLSFSECNACHKSNGVAFTHDESWLREHRLYAERKPRNCQDCHQQSFCLDCHTGGEIDQNLAFNKSNFGADYTPKSHRTDFREIHPIKAREDPKACYRCHNAQRFCAECHNKFKPDEIAPVSHREQFSSIKLSSIGPTHANFNPSQCPTCHLSGVFPAHTWSSAHAREARRNLASCQTCHPNGDVCMKCHSAETGLRINPHPRNWGSISNNFGRASDNRTCLRCHRTVP
ncbi:MAG: hypothetical protein P8013_13885 [Candidatus Sulfobium sp.]|jgi:hypothetical protein